MPLTRSELIARSLVHANQMTGGNVPLPALIDHNHFNHLSPEEKAEVITQYARHSANGAVHEQPTVLNTVMTGAKAGLMASIVPAVASGALTLPSLLALRAATGNQTAMKDVLRRTLIPVGILGGLGVASGIVSEFIQRGNNAANNQYVHKILESVRDEGDADEQRVKSMALVAAAPYLNRRIQGTEAVGPNVRQQLITNYMHPGTEHMISEVMGVDKFTATNASGREATTEVPYNNWNWVRGVGPIHKDAVNHHYKITKIED